VMSWADPPFPPHGPIFVATIMLCTNQLNKCIYLSLVVNNFFINTISKAHQRYICRLILGRTLDPLSSGQNPWIVSSIMFPSPVLSWTLFLMTPVAITKRPVPPTIAHSPPSTGTPITWSVDPLNLR
jgi:hypothetical protein